MLVFHPQTGTAPYLRSVANFKTFILALMIHLSQPFLCIFLLPPLSYRLPVSRCSSYYHLYLAPAPHLLYWHKTPPTWTSSPPVTRQPPPLISAPHAACLHLLLFPASVFPPFSYIGMHPGTFHTLEVLLSRVPPSPFFLCISSLSSALTPGIFWFLFFFGWMFSREGKRQGRL